MQKKHSGRVVIQKVKPQLDCGLFPIKRVAGEKVTVEADIFSDGHDSLSASVLYRAEGGEWNRTAMTSLPNDRWTGEFYVGKVGNYDYTVHAWIDRFMTWRKDLEKRLGADQDVTVDILIGAELVKEASARADGKDSQTLKKMADILAGKGAIGKKTALALDHELSELMLRYPDDGLKTEYGKILKIVVDPLKARFSTWYEMFPRSMCGVEGGHGTLAECEKFLPYIAEMGFDVLYLPPIHPIGKTKRKGRNNAQEAGPDDPGSPWAIGSEEGGHKSIDSRLGNFEDFEKLRIKALDHGIEIALDIAFQCSPDHPWVKEHPDWFTWRPDKTVQYAENPPKKYEDIYPINFDTKDRNALWDELKSVFTFWIEKGVKIFRVDNPHTKPFGFWEWTIREIKNKYPEAIFLSEAFTRPKVKAYLAKAGFTQSYTYFAWRNTKWELTSYFEELSHTGLREYYRPNLWTNTPDILTEYLQFGGRQAFIIRLVLAATLGASYGIYGPAFELQDNAPRYPGSEEYLDSEKYQIRNWELDRPDSLKHLIARINTIRHQNPALQWDTSLAFHYVSNDQMIFYSKISEDRSNIILTVVNLDPYHTQSGWVDVPLEEFGINSRSPYQVHDLLGDSRYIWYGGHNYVELNPYVLPASVFLVRRKIHTERDFDYYM